jgi:hypothetical protein
MDFLSLITKGKNKEHIFSEKEQLYWKKLNKSKFKKN